MRSIFLQIPNTEGTGLHRAILPAKFCVDPLKMEDIRLTAHSKLTSLDHDAFVFHGVPKLPFVRVIGEIKQRNKKVVVNLDDDVWNVPTWNPAAKSYNEQAIDMADWTLKMADHVIVSTEPLKKVVQEKTKAEIHVCPNLVDATAWPTPSTQPNDRVRVLWAGSIHHARDMDEVVPAIDRLTEEYGEKVHFLFWGDLPDAFAEIIRVKYSHLDMAVPAEKYRNRVGLIQRVPTEQYAATHVAIQPDIGIAPLCMVRFNYSKSCLKWHDVTMAGAAFIGTKLPPYDCVHNKVDGLLVRPGDKEGWYQALKTLIDYPAIRNLMARQAMARILAEHTWQGKGKEPWLQAFRKVVSK